MKKTFSLLVMVISLLCITTVTFATSGKAYIPTNYFGGGNSKVSDPHNYSDNNGTGDLICMQLFFSNITDDVISVKVTFYKQDGTISDSSFFCPNNLSNYKTREKDCSVSFTLNGKKSGQLTIEARTNFYGYGIIEWTQSNGSENFGMIAHGNYCQEYIVKGVTTTVSRYAIPINSGLPF